MDMRNGAPSPFQGIPGASKMARNRGPSGMNWEAITAAFEFAIEEYGLDWGDTVTTEQASEIRRVAKDHGLTTHVERVAAWFENWYLYYPFVDPVAVDRAVQFDLDVWGGLTARERDVVIERLVDHPDPWCANEYSIKGPLDGAEGGPVEKTPTTSRASQWLQVDWSERRHLANAVRHRALRMGRL